MENLLQRITFDPHVLLGKPVIRGMRISVEMILELLAKGSAWQREARPRKFWRITPSLNRRTFKRRSRMRSIWSLANWFLTAWPPK